MSCSVCIYITLFIKNRKYIENVFKLSAYFREFPYRVALFPWIRIGLFIVGTIRFNSMNLLGHVLNDYFNRSLIGDDDAKI